jgi:hypothetical protein
MADNVPASPPILKTKKPKKQSRADRWVEAASEAHAALETLRGLQEEYQEWLDNLPENLQSSPVGEKLQAVTELDVEGAISTAEEAEAMELPQGFGRD